VQPEIWRGPCHLQRIDIEDGCLRVCGLSWDESSRIAPRRIRIETTGPLPEPPVLRMRLPSLELEKVFGKDAAQAGFEIVFPAVSLRVLDIVSRARLIVEFDDVRQEAVSLFPRATIEAINRYGGLENLRIGVGITTWNREHMVVQTIESLRAAALCPLEFFVSDDGSTDRTVDALKAVTGISWLTARNRGIAWNKNRALFYLHRIRKCDVVLLIEDDVQPTKKGWDVEWLLATLSFGHVNYAPEGFLKNDADGVWYNPIRSGLLTGQCSGFTSEALDYVGYLDSRFRRFGHEHVEHTMRMIRAGYGGIHQRAGERHCTFFLINGSLRVIDMPSSGDPTSVEINGRIFDAIWNDGIHRMAWRTDDEMRALRDEFSQVVTPPTLGRTISHG